MSSVCHIQKMCKRIIPLVKPIPMCIGRDNLHRQVVHAFRFGGLLKLFFSGQIVVNSGKVNLARLS